MTKVALIAIGTPQVSAIAPRRVTPIPPALMVKPTIIPEAIPRWCGSMAWAMTVVRPKVEINTIPEIARIMNVMNPLLL